MKYFEQVGSDWRLKPEVGNMVDFRPCNLLGDLRSFGTFDLVFCRNVLIYFDQPTKRTVLSAIGHQMHADSFLMLGGSESMYGISDAFADITGQRGLYRRARPGEQTPSTFSSIPSREASMPRAANQ
jgi:chemotaxis protein methyltransferase CheR